MRFLTPTLKTTAALSIAALGLTAVAGCDKGDADVETVNPTVTTPDTTVDGPAERTGEAMDNAVDKTGDAMGRAADKTGAAVNDAATKTGNAMDRAGDKAENTIEDIQAGAGTTTRPAMK